MTELLANPMPPTSFKIGTVPSANSKSVAGRLPWKKQFDFAGRRERKEAPETPQQRHLHLHLTLLHLPSAPPNQWLRNKCEKCHHSLKALAIREKKIHIIGSPKLMRPAAGR